MEGGGNGKLDDLLFGLGLGDSKDSGGGEIGNCIGETGANCWHLSTRRRRSILEWKADDGGGADSVEDDCGRATTCGRENFLE